MHWFGLVGAIMAALSVAAGAFGAHALRDKIDDRGLEVFEIGVRYQMYHALALLFVGWMVKAGFAHAKLAGAAFLFGIVVFSGTLYMISLTGQKKLGMITPLGGLAFIVGWIVLTISIAKSMN